MFRELLSKPHCEVQFLETESYFFLKVHICELDI